MYVYRTDSFNDELKKYRDLLPRVENLCSKLKTSNFIVAQERFERIHAYLKRKEGNFRLIAKIIRVNSNSPQKSISHCVHFVNREPVLCFLKLYNRGEPEYKHFLNYVKYQNNLFQESALTELLSSWLTEQKSKYTQVTTLALKDDLRIWLQRPDWQINYQEMIIYESELWGQKFSQPEIRSQASFYRQIIEDLINQINNNKLIGLETNWSNIQFYGQESFYIVYSNLITQNTPQEQVLLLIAPVLGFPNQKIIDSIIDSLFNHNLVKENTNESAQHHHSVNLSWWQKHYDLSLDDLITYTKRSYPWYLVLDEMFWLRIQDGNGVNLALSREEKQLLHSVSTGASLPLFLNGRAGSGKSTMLFYLFADYCYRHLQICRQKKQDLLAKPHPLFITYSPNLADFAKVKVQSILKHHHHFLAENSHLEKIPSLGLFFQSLRSFLLKLLPNSEKEKFAEKNYLSFHKFRELFNERWQNLSPEKCWLVIQTFIKGYELIDRDIYLESAERYQQIPKKERTVTVAEFIQIRDRVWYWYKKYTQDRHLWDDRDLVRTILALHCYQPEYTVIFCDEAQDFTRLELQLIMGLSVFSLYNLGQETIFSLPFAFAGDPLQTLNPTGFRWASFKAAFHDEILTPLRLADRSPVKLQLQQLKDNYRSAAAIVKVNNLIQLWRKVLFNLTDIEPQKAKKISNFIPQKFIINNNITLEHLQYSLQDTIILIPCDEGAEKEFIFQDNLLNSLCTQEENSETPWNILSAISAKGLEFKQVILYGFGEACPLNLANSQAEITEEDKYFLNKLYVAASRATEKLFIIDSIEGENKLWVYTSDRKYLNYFLSQIENTTVQQQWQENIGLVSLGNSLLELTNDHIEADALTLETVGINTENITLINKAISVYQKLQNKVKADFCLAYKSKLERNFLTAGKLFLSINKLAEAGACFWQAMAWRELQQLTALQHDEPSELTNLKQLSPITNFMVKSSVDSQLARFTLLTQDIIEITNFLKTELLQNNLIEERESNSWQVFLLNYCNQLQKTFTNPLMFSQQDWLNIAYVLNTYFKNSTPEVKTIIAHCFYFGRQYHQAVQYWEELDEEPIQTIESKYYYIAKAKITQLPQGLLYLYQGKQYQIIINLWLDYRKPLDTAWLEYVALSFIAIEQYHHALTIYFRIHNLEKIQYCWQQIKQNRSTFKQYKKLINYYLQHQYWEQAITFAFNDITQIQIKSYFIYRLANSKLNPDNLTTLQRQKYQRFIQQNFLNNSQWRQYLTVQHLGIAIEKIGSYLTTLTFYERYVNSTDRLIQEFTRNRWIVTKQKQIKYFRSQVQTAKVQKSQKQLMQKVRKWQINLNSLSLTIPTVSSVLHHYRLTNNLQTNSLFFPQQKSLTEDTSFAYKQHHTLTITNLPHNTKITNLANGIQQYQFNCLLLRIAESIQQLALIDCRKHNNTHKIIHLDWRKGTIKIDTTIVITSNNQPLSFTDSQGKYQGVLWRDLNPRLELQLNNYSPIIIIKFTNL